MDPLIPPGGRVPGATLAKLLGPWRHGDRSGSVDLAGAVRMLVLDGRLTTGTRLPAERELADALGASRTLVTAAMDRLREEGLVASRRGAGSWVTLPGGAARPGGWWPTPVPDLLDLSCVAPPAPPELAAAVDRARLRVPEHLVTPGYQPLGLTQLRERIAGRYTERGLPTRPDQVLVTNGAQHALAMVLRLLVGPGDRVLMEHPTYPNAIEAVLAAHATPVPVPMAEDGWDADGLAAALRQAAPRMAFLIPDFHNPTGLRMDVAARERLAAALRRTRTPAFVDETLVELDLGEDPVGAPPPFAAFAEDLVVTAGSTSKSFWGGLRIGWVRASTEVVHRLVAARPAMDLGSPVLEQLVVAELLADPEPLLGGRRADFRRQRDVLAEALREHCPGWEFRVPQGGLVLWARLEEPVSTRLAVAAEGVGVRIAPGSRFAVTGSLERHLRLPYSLPANRLVEAAQRLGMARAAIAPRTTAADLPLPVT
ncbi:GntR family transcriptional regulator [Longimycelium tulufanense]|uniref:GntR family transcriptional regulator n=1 Tax=Longimycelium tulufanense TaxID=907463 RepID=A0A8J3FWU4_9PSEU|nr:PLP-dependent aminotransferase family protein [Longimycelium tulufanense]GGM69384.1 GntR family transcriptional regulator [Longimycelium tulufanense]